MCNNTQGTNRGEVGKETTGHIYNNQFLINRGQLYQGCAITQEAGPASGSKSPEDKESSDSDNAEDVNIDDVMESVNTARDCLDMLYPEESESRLVEEAIEKATTACDICDAMLLRLSGSKRKLAISMIRNSKFSLLISEGFNLRSYIFSHDSRNLHDALLRATNDKSNKKPNNNEKL